jgi:hypothetical protein
MAAIHVWHLGVESKEFCYGNKTCFGLQLNSHGRGAVPGGKPLPV